MYFLPYFQVTLQFLVLPQTHRIVHLQFRPRSWRECSHRGRKQTTRINGSAPVGQLVPEASHLQKMLSFTFPYQKTNGSIIEIPSAIPFRYSLWHYCINNPLAARQKPASTGL